MGTKRPQCRCDWDLRLKTVGKRLGLEVIAWDSYPAKRNKVLIRCKHKEQWVYPHGQLKKKHCCKVSSKLAENNPAHGIPSWNAGTVGISTGHEFGGHPSEEDRCLPGTLYFIRYLDESGIHFKIGITKLTLAERFRKGQLVSILHLHHATLGECFDLEQSLLKWAKSQGFRYSSPTTTELLHPASIPHVLSKLTTTRVKLDSAPHLVRNDGDRLPR
jgi:hypothetical protein